MQSKSFLLEFFLIVVAAVIGYAVGNIFPVQDKVATERLTVDEELLTNQVFYEWWASVEGTVVAKTSDSITVERDGNQAILKVSVADGRTTISRQTQNTISGATPAFATYEDIAIGTRVRGGAAIARKGTTGMAGEENVALATTLVIIDEE